MILRDIINTGNWQLVAQSNRTQDLMLYDSVVRVRQCPQIIGPDKDLCLSLWTEQQYRLSVDGPTVEVPDCCAERGALLEEHFKPVHGYGERSPPSESIILHKVRARSDNCRTPILIPSIPRFIDAELDRFRINLNRKIQGWNLESVTEPIHALQLVRRLRLDLHWQKTLLLRAVAPRHWPTMERLVRIFEQEVQLTRARGLWRA